MLKIISIFFKNSQKIAEYSLFFLVFNSIFGTIVYYLYRLNYFGVIISLILSILALLFSKKFLNLEQTINENNNDKNLEKKDYFYLSIYALSYLILLLILFLSRSDKALVSPWQVVNQSFFYFYAIASLLLFIVLKQKRINSKTKIFLLSAHYFISFAVTLIVYKIAYGFDPFIHQASLELIADKGQILPKTPYYIGAYSIIIIINKLFALPISLLNKIIVPVLSAIFLPLATYRFLNHANRATDTDKHQKNKINLLTILFLLILTFSPLTLNTPQNLSYLFLILTVLSALSGDKLQRTALLALTSTAIHPLSGLAALMLLIWLIFKKYRYNLKPKAQRILNLSIWLFNSLAIPLALILGANFSLNSNKLKINLSQILKKLSRPINLAGQENYLLNFTYFIANNYQLFIIILIFISLIILFRSPKFKQSILIENIKDIIFINSSLLFSYFLIIPIKFNNLISYEQNAYAERIPLIILILFLPLLAILLQQLITNIIKRPQIERMIWLFFALGFLTISLYISYPRLDKYWNSHGYSTSINDLKAVQEINQDYSQDYLVLANQQVSAAALKEFGFRHYYQTNSGLIYFYSIPTGGPLYQYYLNMVYKKPEQKNIIGACQLTKVKQIYLVINKYWQKSGQIINEAKLTADHWWSVDNSVYIFAYPCQTINN